MFSKDFENFELRLKKLREESQEVYQLAEKKYNESFEKPIKEALGEDRLGIGGRLRGYFVLEYAEDVFANRTIDLKNTFQSTLSKSLHHLSIEKDKKQRLEESLKILVFSSLQEEHEKPGYNESELLVVVEEMLELGEISQAEVRIIESRYSEWISMEDLLTGLSPQLQKMLRFHMKSLLSSDQNSSREDFMSEYHDEIETLKTKNLYSEELLVYVSRSFYKTPGKYRKYECPKKRLKRTMKLALLRLLRLKLGNVEAEKLRERFELGETFIDFYAILWRIFEVIGENPDGEEVYVLLKHEEDTRSCLTQAEVNTQKILEGESVTANISQLIDACESELEGEILEKVLDDDTFLHGDELIFHQGDGDEAEQAGVYAEGTDIQREGSDESDDEYERMIPQVAFELITKKFDDIQKEKTKAFGEGRYDHIDDMNDKLFSLQSKLEKLTKILEVMH